MGQQKGNTLLSGICNGCGRQYVTLAATACPQCGGSIVGAAGDARLPLSWLSIPPLRYPLTYLLFVAVAAADVVLTFLIVWQEGTRAELNAVARGVIETLGLPGAMAFKFALVVFIVVMCEVIARRREKVARKLAEWSVAITTIPVVVSLVQLWRLG